MIIIIYCLGYKIKYFPTYLFDSSSRFQWIYMSKTGKSDSHPDLINLFQLHLHIVNYEE